MFDDDMFGAAFAPQGQGWTGIPGIVTDEGGTVGGMPGTDTWTTPAGTASAVANAVMHPTARQVLFFAAVVLLVFAWRGHLKSMLA